MTKFTPSAAQQAFFDWVQAGSGNCILEAVAGAGKTTTIVEAIARMKGRVWFGVYNKKMADEIKEKISKRPDISGRSFPREAVFTGTFHSMGFSIIRNFHGKSANVEVDDRKVQKIIDSLILEREAVEQMRREDLREMAPAVTAIVSMAKNRGFVKRDPNTKRVPLGLTDAGDDSAWIDMVEHFDFQETLPENVDMSTVIKFARAVLCRNNRDSMTIDFDDMVYLPLARNMRSYTHDWVLIDEAQDTNPTRRALARKLLARGGRLVAVGDPHQAIFGFTGADNDSLEQISRDFNCETLPLTVTYRCPKAVVRLAQQFVSHITAHESAPEGEVIGLDYADITQRLLETPRELHGETAILCRYNKYLVALCFKLIRNGVPAKIEGRSIGDGLIKLAGRWKRAKTLNGLETKLREYQEREVRKALEKEQEDKADRITDQVETLFVIMGRAREQGIDQVADLKVMIEDMFSDNVQDKGLVTLCSAHKSKGLEWNTVYLLDREKLMPSKFARQPWQVDQEINLIYVAVTRAKATLVEVTGVVEDKPSELDGLRAAGG